MPDQTSQLHPRLLNNTLPGLNLGDGFVVPDYDGQSILNIPDTICQWMGVPQVGPGSLIPEISQVMGNAARRAIVILVDALAYHRLQQWMENAPVWQSLATDGILAPLTSVVPSTTSSAITTLWTGGSPASHGIIGYEMWLKQYSMVANMILHAPMTFKGSVDSLAEAGFKPENFLPMSTIGSHLWNHGVKSYAFNHHSIAHSGLSRMLMRDVEIIPFATPASMWVSMRQLIENKPDERMYIWSYWPAVDGLSHRYGPDDERVVAEFSHFSQAFEEFFLKRLSPDARKDTVVILTADHGQTHTPLKADQLLVNNPELDRHLRLKPTCENRFAFLYLNPGSEPAVRRFFEQRWPGRYQLVTSTQALSAGLFGPGPHHPDITNRIGDLIAISREGAYLWWADEKDFLLGRHGGLNPHEMIVPFLAARLS
jgi:hypothetical protein